MQQHATVDAQTRRAVAVLTRLLLLTFGRPGVWRLWAGTGKTLAAEILAYEVRTKASEQQSVIRAGSMRLMCVCGLFVRHAAGQADQEGQPRRDRQHVVSDTTSSLLLSYLQPHRPFSLLTGSGPNAVSPLRHSIGWVRRRRTWRRCSRSPRRPTSCSSSTRCGSSSSQAAYSHTPSRGSQVGGPMPPPSSTPRTPDHDLLAVPPHPSLSYPSGRVAAPPPHRGERQLRDALVEPAPAAHRDVRGRADRRHQPAGDRRRGLPGTSTSTRPHHVFLPPNTHTHFLTIQLPAF